MKLRNKLAIISATSMLAFVGIGYAAWTFNNSVEQEQEVGTYVTSAISANNVALSGNTTVYLVLDQEKPYWSTAVNNGSKPVELANGKITVTPSYELQNQNDGASWTYTLTSAMDVDSDIATYVNVGAFDETDKTGTVLANGGLNQISAVDYDLPTLAYTANKPTTYAGYQSMLSAVDGKVITFTFNCTFVEN
jgi:hypothetical protein